MCMKTPYQEGLSRAVIDGIWGKTYRRKVGIIQAAINRLRAETYVEIGVDSGECFWRVDAKRKIAVDPIMQPAFRSTFKGLHVRAGDETPPRESLALANSVFFEMTSDNAFTRHATVFAEQPIDVVLIDGLHTYEQSLKDVQHCLNYLRPEGVIVMHDCNPASEAMAVPAPSFEAAEKLGVPGWNSQWSGDVWKTIVHLRSCRDDLQVFVLDCDLGVGIVSRRRMQIKTHVPLLDYSAEGIAKLCYVDLDRQRKMLLNLKHPRYFHAFLANLKHSK